jgi:gamma-glutamyltranspeptidase
LTHDNDWKQPLQEGQLLQNPKLAETLEAIMKEGSSALYSGARAQGLARDIAEAGGIITQQDIEKYVPTLRSPVVAHDIQGFSIAGVPPPSSGGAAIVAIARFLAGYATPYATFGDTLSVHRFVEACRHIFAMRMSLSDPDYNTEIVKDVVQDMTVGTYIAYLRNMTLDNITLPLSRYGGTKWAQLNDTDGDGDVQDAKEGDRRRLRQLWRKFGYLEDHGTSHFSVVDEDGNAGKHLRE